MQYKAGTLKALSNLDQASILWHSKNGSIVECGYWWTNPYSGKTCTAQCKSYSDEGNCTGYICKETGSSIPSDYNGSFSDCTKLYEFYKENFNIAKICDSNAYSNGCIPKYEGKDTVYMAQNTDTTEYDAAKATSGCGSFRQSNILAGKAFVTTDGMIYFPYGTYWSGIMAVDVNGFKGPNKWGHDVHVFQPKLIDQYSDPSYTGGGCEFIENGGVYTNTLLYSK